jgi:hypothetical protein
MIPRFQPRLPESGHGSAICENTPDARLRADARGGDGGVRQKLAAGISPMTKADGIYRRRCAKRHHEKIGE